ncbi:arsenic resistance protein [Achromobacter insolitus]|uniref:arsenic resistance protein n=1 Tax=Achromobacter insolitus TaxID=217204 RepID=UPI00241CE2EC|nr:bile acid:sodium symporter [Achromobacter insolitus]
MTHLRDRLERHQVSIYFLAALLAALVAYLVPATTVLEGAINPALALMLFVTFLQVPMADLGRAFTRVRFLAVLLGTNFLAIPLLVTALVQFLPADPLITLGVLLVLLTPCIDYVVTFAHLGRADARLLLAATPTLLIVQMMLLPLYLRLFLGEAASDLVHLGPFLHAFLWLIVLPLLFAALVQFWGNRRATQPVFLTALGLLPVPATALVLFIVIAAITPQLGAALDAVVLVLPVYVAFAIIAPLIGWYLARAARISAPASRAVAFSGATRNSLVVLPLALAVPNAIPILPAVIVAQTIVELCSELAYVRLMPLLGKGESS